jgi:hypothetical protein
MLRAESGAGTKMRLRRPVRIVTLKVAGFQNAGF